MATACSMVKRFSSSDPLNADSDGDGIVDGNEVQFGLDPTAFDATTAVVGSVADSTGAAVEGATVIAFDRFVETTGLGGAFSMPNIPTGLGDVEVFARVIRGGVVSDGVSAPVPPVSGGATDVGIIALQPVIGRVTGAGFESARRSGGGCSGHSDFLRGHSRSQRRCHRSLSFRSDSGGQGDNSADADSDGLTNLEEQGLGTDPNSSDSDQDGLTDGDEVGVHGTDPLNADTDGGGRNDGDEVLVDGTDPLDANDDL